MREEDLSRFLHTHDQVTPLQQQQVVTPDVHVEKVQHIYKHAIEFERDAVYQAQHGWRVVSVRRRKRPVRRPLFGFAFQQKQNTPGLSKADLVVDYVREWRINQANTFVS